MYLYSHRCMCAGSVNCKEPKGHPELLVLVPLRGAWDKLSEKSVRLKRESFLKQNTRPARSCCIFRHNEQNKYRKQNKIGRRKQTVDF